MAVTAKMAPKGVGVAYVCVAANENTRFGTREFLLLIGIVNLVVWFEIFVLFQRMRKGAAGCETLDQLLGSRGLIARFTGPLFRLVTSSRQAYPMGFLFGLGFDTASEIALLAISVAAVASALPIAAVVGLPLLFAAGMTGRREARSLRPSSRDTS